MLTVSFVPVGVVHVAFDGLTRAAIPATHPTLVLLGTGAQDAVTPHMLQWTSVNEV